MEYWLFNTDETEPEGEGKHEAMLKQHVVAAWGYCKGFGAEVTLNHPKPGDVIYFFRAGHGIIARATATDEFSSPSSSVFNAAGEYCRPVDELQIAPESNPVTVAEIKSASGYQVPFRQIMGRIFDPAAQSYLNRRFRQATKHSRKSPANPSRSAYSFPQITPELRKKTERSAVRFVTAVYEKANWHVKSVERENVGYDLHCTRQGLVECVEVKGTTGEEQAFVLTANELGKATSDEKFVLYVVTNVLSKPKPHRYSSKQLIAKFRLEPTQYRARLK